MLGYGNGGMTMFRGQSLRDGKWKYGYFVLSENDNGVSAFIVEGANWEEDEYGNHDLLEESIAEVDMKSVGQSVGLYDKDNCKIYEGDIMEFKDADGSILHLVALIEATRREIIVPEEEDFSSYHVVFNNKDTSRLPCVDSKGVSDVEKMKIVGNVYDKKRGDKNALSKVQGYVYI